MAKIRQGAADKWSRRASVATEDYQTGVDNPRTDWKTATMAAAKNQEAGVMEAIKNKSFEKGVAQAGSEKWKQGALIKGSQRFAQGVQDSQGAYEQGVAPYLRVIEQTSLPPRYPKGDPRNLQRVTAIASALRAAKVKK